MLEVWCTAKTIDEPHREQHYSSVEELCEDFWLNYLCYWLPTAEAKLISIRNLKTVGALNNGPVFSFFDHILWLKVHN